MEADARTVSTTAIEADLCVIGAGPAGLSIAHAFCDQATSVVVLESGGRGFDRRAQSLNEAQIVGSAYGDLLQTRQRQVGGTVNGWNSEVDGEVAAKFVPLDAIDFGERSWVPRSGWPISRDALDPYYLRAHRLCALGPFDYRAHYWRSEGREPLALQGPLLGTGVYQFGVADVFADRLPAALCAAKNVTLLTQATVLALRTDASGERVREACVARPGAAQIAVRAKRFVLAGGAIENARLLLVSGNASGVALGNAHDWVGRCFMEHPRDYAMRLIPHRADWFDAIRFYDQHATRSGTTVLGRIALQEAAMKVHQLLNASVTMLPGGSPRPAPATGWGAAIRRRFARSSLPLDAYPRGGAGWSQQRRPAFQFVRLLVNLEQAPDPENRVVLSDRRDRFGIRQVRIHWAWRAHEQRALERLRTMIAGELEALGAGRVVIGTPASPDPRAHHHAGTTRMHDDPRYGVVDRDARVHGVENLYVAGASVFPTAGYANPTLTIVALALRLADRLQDAGSSIEPDDLSRAAPDPAEAR